MINIKVLYPFILATTLLTGCGGYDVGDKFTLKESVLGSDTINDWKEAVKEAKKDGTVDVDGVSMNSLFEDYEVKIIEVSNKDNMILLQLLDGSDEGTKWWVPIQDFEKAIE